MCNALNALYTGITMRCYHYNALFSNNNPETHYKRQISMTRADLDA